MWDAVLRLRLAAAVAGGGGGHHQPALLVNRLGEENFNLAKLKVFYNDFLFWFIRHIMHGWESRMPCPILSDITDMGISVNDKT